MSDYSNMLLPQDRQGLLRNMMLQAGLGTLLSNYDPRGRQSPLPYMLGAMQSGQQGQQQMFRNQLLQQQFGMQKQRFGMEQQRFEAERAERQRKLETEERQQQHLQHLLSPPNAEVGEMIAGGGPPIHPDLIPSNRAGLSPTEAAAAQAYPDLFGKQYMESLFDESETQYQERDMPLPDGQIRKQFSTDGGQTWQDLGAEYPRYKPATPPAPQRPFEATGPSGDPAFVTPGQFAEAPAGTYTPLPDTPGQQRPRYSPPTAYIDDTGQYIGEGIFDRVEGKTELRTVTGERTALPPGARPRTDTGLDRDVITGNQWQALTAETAAEERSVRSIQRYMANVESTEQGLDLLADQLQGHFKTLFGGELTPGEVRAKIASGEIQGLLGGFRTEVVGGGVMTEQDALRVLAALGGDVNALQNKQAARHLLGNILSEKVRAYNETLVPHYNHQLGLIPRGAFSEKQKIEIDPSIWEYKEPEPEMSGDIPTPPSNLAPEDLELWPEYTPEERELFYE